MGPTELEPEGTAAEEMRVLWASLKRRMARVKTAEKKRIAA
jgi:hypothetical protein